MLTICPVNSFELIIFKKDFLHCFLNGKKIKLWFSNEECCFTEINLENKKKKSRNF